MRKKNDTREKLQKGQPARRRLLRSLRGEAGLGVSIRRPQNLRKKENDENVFPQRNKTNSDLINQAPRKADASDTAFSS